MSVAWISGPQVLDPPLRLPQEPVDQEGIGVGGDLGRDPGRKPHEGLRQRLANPERPGIASLRQMVLGYATTAPFSLASSYSTGLICPSEECFLLGS